MTRGVFALFLALSAGAQSEIRSVEPGEQGSTPSDLTVAGPYLYFTADDGITGRELWRIDAQGHVAQVADLRAGSEGSDPAHLTAAGDALYFLASPHGALCVCATRGDGESTWCWTEHNLSALTKPAAVGDALYIAANFDGRGEELWRARFEDRSLELVHEFVPGPAAGIVHWDDPFQVAHGDLYFIAAAPGAPNRRLLWRLAEGAGAPEPVRDEAGQIIEQAGVLRLFPDSEGGVYLFLAQDPYFIAYQAPGETHFVWVYEGEGTGALIQGAVAGKAFYFKGRDAEAGRELWRTFGVPGDAHRVADIAPGPQDGEPYYLTEHGGLVYFNADDGVHGTELWVTDGTAEGTRMLGDFMPGPAKSDPYQLFSHGDYLFFSCYHDVHGEELWRTQGTPESTSLVRDINPGLANAEPYYLTTYAGQLNFSANHAAYGEELWVSDGTGEGTRLAARINPAVRNVRSSRPAQLTPFGSVLYFIATGEDGPQLWVSDGSEAGTRPAAPDITAPRNLIVTSEALYFEADRPDGGASWWVLEGPGVAPVPADAPPHDDTPPHPAEAPWQAGHFAPQAMRPVLENGWIEWEGRVFFAGYTPDTGVELWTLDPGSGDAALFADLFPGTVSGNPAQFILINGRLFFTACDLNRGLEVWESDGTPGGTRVYADFLPTPRSSAPAHLTAVDGHLLFTYRMGEGLRSLARFDTGVNLDTARISYYHYQAGFSVEALAPVGGRIYLSAQHDAFGQELWCYEPDTERCWLVKDILPNTTFDAVENAWRPAAALTE